MEGVDVTTALDRDQRNKWAVFGALACLCGLVSLGISCTPTHCSPHISRGGLGICLSRCSVFLTTYLALAMVEVK